MPPVVRFAVAYAAGLWLGGVFVVPAGWLVALLAAAAAAALKPKAPSVALYLLTLLVGTAIGSVGRRVERSSCTARWRPGPRAVLVRWHDAPGSRGLADVTVRSSPDGCGGRLRVRLSPDLGVPGIAGARAVVVGEYRGAGVLSLRHVHRLDGRRDLRYQIRAQVRGRIERLYGARAPLVEALVLGRRDDMAPEVRRTFIAAGLAHLLAISGLHVGMLFGWLLITLRLLGAGRWSPAVGAVLVWGYVALLGFPAPATRAAAFLTVHAVARLRQRHPPWSAVLAVAGLAVLTVDPAAVHAVGAWLSVAAVWGAWRAGRVLPAKWRTAPPARLVATSIGATVATAPITAWAFGQVAPAGVLSNLVAVPLAAVAVPGVFASLVLGGLVAGGAGLALAGVELAARLGAALPGGQLMGSPGPLFALPWAVAVLGFAWVDPNAPSVLLRRLVRVALLSAAAGWLGLAVRDFHRRPSSMLELHVIDVGQGDAIALRTPHGRWILMDGGPLGPAGSAGRRIVVPYLEHHGADRLAVLIASHGDADHMGGTPDAIRALDPAIVLEPGQPLPTPLYHTFLAVTDSTGVRWQPARQGDTIVIDSVVLAVLHPPAGWFTTHFSPNEGSVVVQVHYRCFDALLTGDIDQEVEARLPVTGPIDVLKVAHHGSRTSSSAAWLAAVQPRVAVISVGAHNRYGHPSPQVLARFRSLKIPVWRTDRGTVTIRTDGEYLVVSQGSGIPFAESVRCRIRALSRSSASSSSRSACTRAPPVTLPTCSTTWPSPVR